MSDQNEQTAPKPKTLNGQPVTDDHLKERMEDKSVRIVEKGGEGSGDFRELKKLHG